MRSLTHRPTHRLAAFALIPLLLLVAAPWDLACCVEPATAACPAGGCCDEMTMESVAAADCCGTLEATEPPGSRGLFPVTGLDVAPRIADGDRPVRFLVERARPAPDSSPPPPDDLQALYSTLLI